MITIPENVKHYLENEKTVPLVEVKGTKWYYISKEEKETLQTFVREVDKIPEKIWRNWPESEILKYCDMGNIADRIVRNCITREG